MPSVILRSPSPFHYALEDNLLGHVAFIQQSSPAMTVVQHPDLVIVDSGLYTDTFNKVLHARIDEAHAESRISEAVRHFLVAMRPFSWWVGPCSRPLDLERRLEDFGLQATETELGMIVTAGDLLPIGIPPFLDVHRVRTATDLADFAAVSAANWDPPDKEVAAFYSRSSDLLLHEHCPMRLFMAYVEGSAAAASEVFLSGETAGIYSVATRREFQRRGIGTAMTWMAAEEGRKSGAKSIVLQAAEEGKGIYKKLGFRACCEFVEYQ